LKHYNNLEACYPSKSNIYSNELAIVSQDDDAPSANKGSVKRRKLMCASEIIDSCPSARQAASRHYSLQFLADFAGAVLDNKTGEMLEYRHLI
jgi:hypothetical protein